MQLTHKLYVCFSLAVLIIHWIKVMLIWICTETLRLKISLVRREDLHL